MSKYHVNPTTGEPGLCRAKKACPFGSADEHHETKQDARAAYEELQGRVSVEREKFSNLMRDAVGSMKDVYGIYYLPKGKFTESAKIDLAFFSQEVLRKSVERLYPQAKTGSFQVHSRDALKDSDVKSPEFWGKYFDNAVGAAVSGKRKTAAQELPATYEVHGPRGQVGSREVADKLISIVGGLREDGVEELSDRSDWALGAEDFGSLVTYAEPELNDAGFEYLGNGAEQTALLHVESNTVWKVPYGRIGGVQPEEVLKNTMIGQETFPKNDEVRHAATSGYARDKVVVIAQEYVDTEEDQVPALSRDTHTLLYLAGHGDVGRENYAKSSNGDLVAFDTLGIVWDDIDEYELSGIVDI